MLAGVLGAQGLPHGPRRDEGDGHHRGGRGDARDERTPLRARQDRLVGDSPPPATQPAHNRPNIAHPGTNQVQSTRLWTPHTTATVAMVTRAMRSGSPAGARGRGARGSSPRACAPGHRSSRTARPTGDRSSPIARPAAPSHSSAASTLSASPMMPRSARVWFQ